MTATGATGVIYESVRDPRAYAAAYNALMDEPSNRLRIAAVHETLRRIDTPINRVIDVASGAGAYVEAVRSAVPGGARATFIPVDRQFACVAGYRLNHAEAKPAMADVTRLPFQQGRCDLALCLDIIEHLPDDVGFLRNVGELLRPGGWVLISTHNSRSLQHVLGLMISAVRGEVWRGWDPTHVRFYTAASLGRLMRAAGFEPVAFNGTYYLPFHFPARVCSWPLQRLGAPGLAQAVHRVVEAPLYGMNAVCEALSHITPLQSLGWGIIALGRRH